MGAAPSLLPAAFLCIKLQNRIAELRDPNLSNPPAQDQPSLDLLLFGPGNPVAKLVVKCKKAPVDAAK